MILTKPSSKCTCDDPCFITFQVRHHFLCYGLEGNMKIRAFIDEAFQWYCEEMKSTEDNSRYMYVLIALPKPVRRRRSRRGYDSEGDEERETRRAGQPTILK